MIATAAVKVHLWEGEILSRNGRNGNSGQMTKRSIPQAVRDSNKFRKNGGSILEL